MKAWGSGHREVLRVRDLRLLFGGLVVSATGSWAYNVALLAFAFEQTHSLRWVGLAGLARFVPALLFSSYGGVIAERFDRIRVMVGSDLLCCGWQAALAVTAALDGPIELALVFAALTAICNTPYNPAVAATIPELADEDRLVAANALNSTIENLVVVVGPAIGAVVLALGSPALTFGIDAASFALSALLVSRIRLRGRAVDVTEGGEAGPLRQMAVGMRAITESVAARTLVAYSVLVSFVYGTDSVLFVAVSDAKLGTGAEGFGYLLAGLGVGGVLVAGVLDRLAASGRLARLIVIGTALYCLPTLLLTVVHAPAVAFAIQVVRGGATLVVDVLAVTALQRAVSSDLMARVFGVFFALVLAAISLGAVITPPIVDWLGLDAALVVLGVAPTLLGLAGYPVLVALDRAAAGRLAELAPRIAVLERVSIFAGAGRPALERLAAAAEEVEAPAGAAIVSEGEPAEAIFVLVDGRVEVTSRGEAGAEPKVLREMGPGTYFGEIGVLERIPRTATVTAVEPCSCLRIDGDAFLAAITAGPAPTTLLEDARSRLARTHPSRRITFEPAEEPAADER
jgi:transmembrane secretion effector/cyclic nucleotide-binding protein